MKTIIVNLPDDATLVYVDCALKRNEHRGGAGWTDVAFVGEADDNSVVTCDGEDWRVQVL